MCIRDSHVVYHNKLGTQLERSERVQKIASRIAEQIGADPALARRAAKLAKADLRTLMVGEFPCLLYTSGMKRGYTILEYKSIIRKLRAIRPDISIATDFIVGFPNETEEDFEKTMNLIKEIKFDASFSFVYSKRPGTPAAELPDDTPQSVKLERLQRLQALNTQHAQEISQSMVGSVQRCLVVGRCV